MGIKYAIKDFTTESLPDSTHVHVTFDSVQGFGYIDDAGVFNPIGGMPSETYKDRLFYESFPAAAAYPFVTVVDKIILQYATKIANDPTYWFGNTKFMFVNVSTGEVTDDLTFANSAEMAAWSDANILNDGISAFTEFGYYLNYDVINSEIPTVTKLKGENSLFNVFADGKYSSHEGMAIGQKWGATGANLLNQLWGNLFGENIPFTTQNELSAVWLSRDHRRYEKPFVLTIGSTTRISYPQPTKRYYYDGATFANVDYSTDPDWQIEQICYLTENWAGGITVIGLGGTPGIKKQFLGELVNNQNRTMVAYSVRSVANPTYHAILLKPLSIDTVILNTVDFNKYQLEIIASPSGEAENYVFKDIITSWADVISTGYPMDFNSARMKIGARNWRIGARHGYQRSVSFGSTKYPKIYFRLRDKVTKEISALSNKYIGYLGGGYGIARFIIRDDKK